MTYQYGRSTLYPKYIVHFPNSTLSVPELTSTNPGDILRDQKSVIFKNKTVPLSCISEQLLCPPSHMITLLPIYTTIGGLSSKFDEFLAGRSQFDSDQIMASIFIRLHVANPRPLCDLFFYCLLFFTEKIMRHFAIDAMFTLRD